MLKSVLNRREFVRGMLPTLAMAAVPRAFAAKVSLDDRYVAILSDIHISALNERVFYACGCVADRIAAILRRDPLPKNVVVLGDIAYLYGKEEDYRKALPLFKPLTDLGITVTFALGNHDRRDRFWSVFGELAGKSLVDGRQVVVASAANVDLLLLDSLNEPPTDDRWITPGTLDAKQGEWLAEALPKWSRPVIVCAHHHFYELKVGGKPLMELLHRCPNVMGYMHGHAHFWKKDAHESWRMFDVIRSLSVSCAGIWGDIGYGWMTSQPDLCRVENEESDFYFFEPVPKEKRPPIWDRMVRENAGDSIEFRLRNLS